MPKAPKKKVVILTPAEKFEQLVALKKATSCILKIQDEYNIYVKLAKEFAELDKKAEESPFEGSEQCKELSEECGKKAEELKPKLPAVTEPESRTVMTTAREREQNETSQKKGKGKWIALGVVLLLVAAAICYKATPTRYYIAGLERFVGMNQYAMESYAKLGDYKDSAIQKMEMKKLLLAEAKPGQVVSFGKCKWIVLDKQDGKLLLAKQIAVTKSVYHEKEEAVTWENCSLREQLNQKFIEKMFRPQEQELIVETAVKAEENPSYHTKAGNDTSDKIFILNHAEYEKYRKILGDKARDMRLRTPGKEENTTAYVSYQKKCVDYGVPVNETSMYVRPVMWIQYQ